MLVKLTATFRICWPVKLFSISRSAANVLVLYSVRIKNQVLHLKKAKTFLLQLQLQLGIATVPTTSILMHRCNSCMYPGMYVEVKIDSLFPSLKLS